MAARKAKQAEVEAPLRRELFDKEQTHLDARQKLTLESQERQHELTQKTQLLQRIF